MFQKILFLLLSVFLIASCSADESFNFIEQSSLKDGGTYTVSKTAAPAGISLQQLCGLIIPEGADAEMQMHALPPAENIDSLPKRFDWRENNGVTEIKNQQSCGSCWSFSSVGILESVILIKNQLKLNLSEQDLLNCNPFGYTCKGGWLDAVKYFKTDGCPLEKDEPYANVQKKCVIHDRPYKISDWSTVANTVADIKSAIFNYGPVSSVVASDATFQYYSGGIFNHDYTKMNHAIILVGWDDSLGKAGCWILRNSWGTGWGEKGYMYIEYGKSRVGEYNYIIKL